MEGKIKREGGKENDKGERSVVGREDERNLGRKKREKKIRESRKGERREAGKMKIDSMAR